MTQRISEEALHRLGLYSDERGLLSGDLLSLRTAVRRVHAAEDAYEEAMAIPISVTHIQNKLDIMRAERAKLRAEMAGIDKDEGGKP